MKISQAVSERIKELLANKGISMYKLKNLTGLSHSTFSCIIYGRYNSCNLKPLLSIIYALKTSPKEFFDSALFDEENIGN